MKKRLVLVMLLGVVAGGCATESAHVRDGVRYGVTRGVFRGRWWSYYERGTSFIEGDFYEEAAADFKKALAGRSRDTWQARTYGLHFVEYFPNRELGVAYYHLGQLDEAEERLLLALDQVDTARAHHYLDLVKRAKIARGDLNDTTAPALETSVQEGLIVSTRAVPVEIEASDDVGVSCVMVNGRMLAQRGSAERIMFREELLLVEGPHTIEVKADDLADKAASRSVRVEVDLTGPTIGIMEPLDALVTEADTVRLAGACCDRNGVVRVTVDGRALAESNGATRLAFETKLPLEPGENAFAVAAQDVAGNKTGVAVRVFRGPASSRSARLWQLEQRCPELLHFAAADAGTAATGLTMLLAAVEEVEPVRISLRSPDAERPYRHNKTLRVAGTVTSDTSIASLTINGEPYEQLTGAPKESFNKGIPIDAGAIDEGLARVSIAVNAGDEVGHTAAKEFEVAVEPVFLDSRESRMPVAVLAFAGAGIPDETSMYLRTTTEQKLFERDRFRMLDRLRLQDVLTEQQLAAALADPNEAIQLGKLTTAHVFLVADVFERGDGLEIKTRTISTETSDIVSVLDAFVEDKTDNAQIEYACDNLAAQLEEAFPRLSGEVVAVRSGGAEMMVNWTKEDGVREGMHMLVVHEEEPWVDETTGEVLAPGEFIPVGEAMITGFLKTGVRAKALEGREDTTFEQGMPAVTM